jgi:predicted amidophosphoribosyltransferase
MQNLIEVISTMIPAPFSCPGCGFHVWDGICRTCIRSIRRNLRPIESTTESIEAFAPIVYSFHQTHGLLKYWKEHRGALPSRILFRMHPQLKKRLIAQGFDAIVPIPQTFHRSWRRSHESARTVARYFSNELDVPIANSLELKNENTVRQASLSQWERESAPNPFQISKSASTSSRTNDLLARASKILIVDDLITSGNTMIRASEVIRQHYPHQKIWAGSLGYRPKRSNLFH